MKKTMTRTIQKTALILTLISLGLTACGNKTDTKNADDPSDQTAETDVVQDTSAGSEETNETSSNEDQVQAVMAEIKQCESLDQTYTNEMETNENMTQDQLNQTADMLYTTWDNCLNDVWDVMKSVKSDSEFAKIQKEQRNWITDKENEIQAAGEAYQGGSMQSMAESLKGAELTKKRVYELIDYLE